MSDELGPYAEQQLANLSAEDFYALVARVRPPDEPVDPMARAAAALRREIGVEVRGRESKTTAADALRAYGQSN